MFRAIWFRIRQISTAEKWIRVTEDDERDIGWVGLNTNLEVFRDPRTGQSVTRPRVGPDGMPLRPAMLAETRLRHLDR